MAAKRKLHPLVKLLLHLGPLVLFFFANAKPALFTPWLGPLVPATVLTDARGSIFVATAVFMIAVVVALVVSYALTRHLPIMTLVTLAIVLVFGGLTLVLKDATFIKVKPTIIYTMFSAILLVGLYFGRSFLGIVLESMFDLTEEGWRKLTLRWGLFFLAMAVMNEIVWRTQTTDTWVSYKAFGALPLNFIFAVLQYPLLMRYANPATKENEAA